MNKTSHSPFESYCQLEEVADFFLHEAFRYAHSAAEYEVAGIIYGKLIEQVDPPSGWKVPEMPDSLPEWLKVASEIQVVPDETTAQLAKAWQDAYSLARSSNQKLAKTHKFNSGHIVGHIINLAACVESVINRYLFLLRESGKLEGHLYSSLDRTEIMPKLLFAFKDDILSGKFQISRLKQLFKLRNHSVHFKASTAHSITVTIEELLGIWNEVGQLLERIEGHPTKQDVEGFANAVAQKWFL